MNATTLPDSRHRDEGPWYRQPWPWILMAGPGLVIVAGVITTVIAFKGADGLVVDDYYKQGLGVNRQIARDEAARTLAVRGDIAVDAGAIQLTIAADTSLPEMLALRLVHPFRASEDRVLTLRQTSPGRYAGLTPPLTATRWVAVVETPQWRVSATLDPTRPGPAALAPGVSQ